PDWLTLTGYDLVSLRSLPRLRDRPRPDPWSRFRRRDQEHARGRQPPGTVYGRRRGYVQRAAGRTGRQRAERDHLASPARPRGDQVGGRRLPGLSWRSGACFGHPGPVRISGRGRGAWRPAGQVRRLAAGVPVEYHQPEGPDLLHRGAAAVSAPWG